MINESDSITIEVSCRQMTEEEIKQEKLEEKEINKKYKQEKKEKRKRAKELRKNYLTLDKCMISPKNIKIGDLEMCIECKIVPHLEMMGMTFGHIEERYEPFDNEKVLIKIDDESDCYFELDKINTRKDLKKIRDSISTNGITVNNEMLTTTSSIVARAGSLRIVRDSLNGHPLFENMEEEKISLRKVKQIISSSR